METYSNTKPTEFLTKKLPLAAYLFSKKMKLLRIAGEGRRRIFIFKNCRQIGDLEKKFWDRRAVVNLYEYEQAKILLLQYVEEKELAEAREE